MEAPERVADAVDGLRRRDCAEHGIVVQNRERRHGRATIPSTAIVNRRPKLKIVAPDASPEEAAAVVAALERFMRDTAAPPVPPPTRQNAWQRAGLHEGVSREPGESPPWTW
jgi:hypothetical protein